MRLVRVVLALVALVLVVPVLASCGSSDSTGTEPAGPSGGDLSGAWTLTTADGIDGDASAFGITIEFAAPEATGFGGVNRYMTSFTSTSEGALEFEPIASTLMAGPDDAMQAEQAYLAALETVTGFTVIGGDLQLYAGSDAILSFVQE